MINEGLLPMSLCPRPLPIIPRKQGNPLLTSVTVRHTLSYQNQKFKRKYRSFVTQLQYLPLLYKHCVYNTFFALTFAPPLTLRTSAAAPT
jgi:hypothetical protein